MRERLYFGLKLGFIGNILFIAFGLICSVYYMTYDQEKAYTTVLELIDYAALIGGFLVLAYADYMLCTSVRMRNLLKIGFSFYIVLEAVMMILEINSYRFGFYKPYSLMLAIVHSVVSAAVCFSFLQFDPHNNKLEAVIIVCIGLILGGMLGNIMGIRIYFSILVNAVAFAAMFFGVKFFLDREDIEIDCHGDRARVAEYKSGFFEE